MYLLSLGTPHKERRRRCFGLVPEASSLRRDFLLSERVGKSMQSGKLAMGADGGDFRHIDRFLQDVRPE